MSVGGDDIDKIGKGLFKPISSHVSSVLTKLLLNFSNIFRVIQRCAKNNNIWNKKYSIQRLPFVVHFAKRKKEIKDSNTFSEFKQKKTMVWESLRLQVVQNFCQRLRVFMNIFNFFENCK